MSGDGDAQGRNQSLPPTDHSDSHSETGADWHVRQTDRRTDGAGHDDYRRLCIIQRRNTAPLPDSLRIQSLPSISDSQNYATSA